MVMLRLGVDPYTVREILSYIGPNWKKYWLMSYSEEINYTSGRDFTLMLRGIMCGNMFYPHPDDMSALSLPLAENPAEDDARPIVDPRTKLTKTGWGEGDFNVMKYRGRLAFSIEILEIEGDIEDFKPTQNQVDMGCTPYTNIAIYNAGVMFDGLMCMPATWRIKSWEESFGFFEEPTVLPPATYHLPVLGFTQGLVENDAACFDSGNDDEVCFEYWADLRAEQVEAYEDAEDAKHNDIRDDTDELGRYFVQAEADALAESDALAVADALAERYRAHARRVMRECALAKEASLARRQPVVLPTIPPDERSTSSLECGVGFDWMVEQASLHRGKKRKH
jgi:hypothetical protein